MSLNLGPIQFSYRRFALFLFCVLWLSGIAWWHRRVVMDDPWITFRYAQNLVGGQGLVFNEGEAVEGYSNLTWVWVSAAAIFARIEPLSFARSASWACATVIFFVLCMGWRRGAPPPRSAAAALLLAASYPFGVWTMGGLETILYAGLVLAFALALERVWTQPSGGAAAGLAGVLVLLDLTRPEGFMWAGVVLVVALAARKAAGGTLAVRHLAMAFGVFVLFHAGYSWWRVATFGEFWPNTVQAKVGGSLTAAIWRGIVYLWSYLGGAPFLLLALAGVALWRHRGERLVVVCCLVAGLQFVFTMAVGGDWMPAGRFVVPVLPVLALAAARGMRDWPLFVRMVVIVFFLGAGVLQARQDPALRWCRWAPKEAGHPLLVQPLIETGEYLRTVAAADATFAATEAGVMPYYSRLRFIDMLGLVDAHIASLPGGLHEKFDAAYVLGRRPEYVVLGITMTGNGPVGTWEPDREVLAQEIFARDYEEVHRILRFMEDGHFSTLLPGAMVIYRRRQ